MSPRRVTTPRIALEPGPHPHYEADAARILPRGACETRGIADLTRPFDTNIGRELLHDLIGKAQPQLDVGPARTYPDPGHLLQHEVDLRHRLQDPSTGEALLILASELGRGSVQERV